jgi:hypothetical protein
VVEGLRQAGHGVTPLGIAADGGWIDVEASAAVIDGATKEIPPVVPTVRHLLASGGKVAFPIVHAPTVHSSLRISVLR